MCRTNQRTSLQLLLAMVSIMMFTVGCDTGEAVFTHESIVSQVQKIETIPIMLFAPGNDMQGPNTTKAKHICKERYKSETSDRYKACLNMMLAKYLASDARSFTFEGTLIEFADSDSSWPLPTTSPFGTFYVDPAHDEKIEAIWGINGALCISKPRWGDFYFKNVPPEKRLPDCKASRASGPWIGQPFRDGGVLVSFVVNDKIATLYTYKNNRTGVLFTVSKIPYADLDDSIDVIDLAGFAYSGPSYIKQPYCDDKCPLAMDSDNILLPTYRLICSDDRFYGGCLPPGYDSPHDYVNNRQISGYLKYGKKTFSEVMFNGNFIYRPDLANPRPGMVKLITYYNENKDQYFTTTERIARQILKDTTSKEYAVEGYIFENNPVVLTFP